MENLLGYPWDWTVTALLLGLGAAWLWRQQRERSAATPWSKTAAGTALLAYANLLSGDGAVLAVPVVVAFARHHRPLYDGLDRVARRIRPSTQ